MWKHTLMFLVIGASAFVIVSTGETIEPDEESVGEEDCEKQTDESHSETLVNESSEKKSYESHSETQVDECSEKTPTCPSNEFYTKCRIAQCRAQHCFQLGKPIACASIAEPCNDGGCVCNYEYARHDNGTCVPVEQCPCNKKHEKYYECVTDCPPEGCYAAGRKYKCAAPPKPGTPECKPGCKCEPGYWRNNEGECVTEEECKTNQCPINEEFKKCPSDCPGESCDVDPALVLCQKPPQPGDSNCNPDGCRCKWGYCRLNGICVSRDEIKCPKNEELVKCPSNCPGESCAINPAAVSCARSLEVGDPNCEPDGCRCKWGFCRLNGTCVSRDKVCTKPHEKFVQCPASCPGDSCGVDPRTVRCAEPPQPGDPNCQPDGCVCDPKYCRTTSGQCIYRGY